LRKPESRLHIALLGGGQYRSKNYGLFLEVILKSKASKYFMWKKG
jgi:hypothetical protein